MSPSYIFVHVCVWVKLIPFCHRHVRYSLSLFVTFRYSSGRFQTVFIFYYFFKFQFNFAFAEVQSFRKIRLKHAPIKSRQQPPWRHCRFQISSVVVHISFSEANSNPRVLSHENTEEAEAFHSHTPLMTSEFWLTGRASSCISSTPDVSLWRRVALIALRGFFICYTEVLPATVFSCSK